MARNRLRLRFDAEAPDRIRIGDSTYRWTQVGWLYLAIVLDTFSRRIVGWSISGCLERDLAVSALAKAIEARQPAQGLIHPTAALPRCREAIYTTKTVYEIAAGSGG